MGVQDVDFDGDLWFFADADSHKVAEIEHGSPANAAFADSSSWVSVSGPAEVVRDVAKQRELWGPVAEAWYPDGPETPGLVLVVLHGETAEYWDSPGGRIATVLSLVKAKVTGERYDGGENETVRCSSRECARSLIECARNDGRTRRVRVARRGQARAANAWVRSSLRSSTSSRPTEKRTVDSAMPTAARPSAPSLRCVVVAGCVTIDFESPRLFEMSMIRSASRNANVVFFATSAVAPAGTRRSNVTTVPPPFCCRSASSCCGCEGR